MTYYPYFEFVSQTLTVILQGKEEFGILRIYYDLRKDPWEITNIFCTDSGQEFYLNELSALDGLYIIKRLGEIALEHVSPRDPDL